MKSFKIFLSEMVWWSTLDIMTPDDLSRSGPKIVKKIKELLKSKKKSHILLYNYDTNEILGPMTLPKLEKQKPGVLKGKDKSWVRIIQKKGGPYYSE